MQFSKLAAAASWVAFVLAGPLTTSQENSKLAKRSEGIHLVNCGYEYSVVVYCADDSNCNFGPGTGNGCEPTNGGLQYWEGQDEKCTFPSSGVTFYWDIYADAQSQADYTYVGDGNNGFTDFSIYKDDQHVMYTDGYGNECRSIYYCLDA